MTQPNSSRFTIFRLRQKIIVDFPQRAIHKHDDVEYACGVLLSTLLRRHYIQKQIDIIAALCQILINLKNLRNSLLIIILFGLSNCVPISYSDNSRFYRQNRTSTYTEETYKLIDTIKIYQIRICKEQKEIIRNKLKSKGKVNIIPNVNTIQNIIVNSMKSNFNNVEYQYDNETKWNINCKYLQKGSLLSNYYKANLKDTDGNSLDISLDIEVISSKNYDVSDHAIHINENDLHNITYSLRLAIINGNELIYMDSHNHSKSIFGKRDSIVEHQVSKNVVDFLINKSLTEYFRRLK